MAAILSRPQCVNVRGPSYPGLTRSISCLLMPWILTSQGHQHPWYWLFKIHSYLSSMRNVFQLPLSYQYQGMIEIVSTWLCFCWKNYGLVSRAIEFKGVDQYTRWCSNYISQIRLSLCNTRPHCKPRWWMTANEHTLTLICFTLMA